MAIKAVAVDEQNIHHLDIGLNRENIDDILNGKIVALGVGFLTGLTEESGVVLIFAETDELLEKRFPPPPGMRPV